MIDIGKYIWVEDENFSWVPAKVLAIENDKYKVFIQIDEYESTRLVDKNVTYSEVHPSCLTGVDDLLMLGDFNQQTLLHNTRTRYAKDKIYSFIGMPILIAVNPYKTLNIYTEKTMNIYKKFFNTMKTNPTECGLPIPHLYHLAEAAYCDMLNDKKNQSLIISGESGSGKTESTKIILKYLALSSLDTTGEKSKNLEKDMITVEKQVLDSNPLLEAFGNAKTVKNNNSSRFGKFIQVSFTEHGKILSARIYNYLLEKSRVVSLQKGERNYHIFYQFLLGADDNEKNIYKIKDLDYFKYLNQGCFDIDDTDDCENFKETKECMNKLTFTQNEINYIFSIIMGILYLGNIEFVEGRKESRAVTSIDEGSIEDFENTAYFLGIDKETLQSILTQRVFLDPLSKQTLKRELSISQSYDCRDAIAKSLYSKMFDYIVGKINRAIANKEEKSKVNQNKIHKIGLLDIFGFENFDKNSFEQLCINYANERLQQYFNNHIFKLEQETYKKEGIDWTQVDFVDNNNIIELIDNGKISIFGLLDSEGITPNSNDKRFKNNVYQLLKNNEALGETDDNENKICINHYAGAIEYETQGFVEKNLDELTNDITEALVQSKNKLIKKLFEKKDKDDAKKQNKKGGAGRVPQKLQSDTLSKQFKTQLDELLQMLGQSNPRYVKCIKPNSLKKPLILDSVDVMEQLLCAGVLEAIKIRKQGYNIRRNIDEFYKTYHILTPDIDIKKNNGDSHKTVEKMISLFLGLPDMKQVISGKKKMIQIGKTIVFMKEEVKAILDYRLNRIKYIYLIQSTFRGMKVRKKVRKILHSIRKIQNCFRGKLLREFYRILRKQTKKIQKNWRFYIFRKAANKMIKSIEEEKRKKLLEEMKQNELEGKNTQDIKKQLDNIDYEAQKRETAKRDRELLNEINNSKKLESFEEDENNKIKANQPKKNPKKGRGKKASLRNNKMNENLYYGGEEFTSNLDVENEMKKTISSLQEELFNTKKERDKYKNEYEKTLLELKHLKSNQELLTNEEPSEAQEELIKKLKSEINEKDTNIEIMSIQIDDLKKAKTSLTEITENLKIQANKRKEKFEKETQSLYQKIQELEIAKNEYERRLTQDTKEERDSKSLFNMNPNFKVINDLKKDNKTLQDRYDELKNKDNKIILELRKEIAVKDFKLKTIDSSVNNEEYSKMQRENEAYKERIEEMQKQIEDMLTIDEKSHSKALLKQKDQERKLLKEQNENYKLQLDKAINIREAFKKQLMDKEAELEHYKKMNEESREEIEKLTDENMSIKKEYNLVKTKVNVGNADIRNKSEAGVLRAQLQMKEMQKKMKEDQEKIEKLENSLYKKKNILESKKKMNLLLIDLAKIKRSEVHCIEGLNLTKSNQLKDALVTLRAKESILLAQLAQVTKEDQEIDDEDSDEDEEQEEGEEEEEESDEEEEGEGEEGEEEKGEEK